jgi:hypothetical protein
MITIVTETTTNALKRFLLSQVERNIRTGFYWKKKILELIHENKDDVQLNKKYDV